MAKSQFSLPDIDQFQILASSINHVNKEGQKMNNKEIKAFADSFVQNFSLKKQPIVKDYINNITSVGITSNTKHTVNAYVDVYTTAHTKDAISSNIIRDMAKAECKNFLMKGIVDPGKKELHNIFVEMQKTIDSQAKEIVDLKTEVKALLEKNTSLKHEVNSLKLKNQSSESSENEQKQQQTQNQGQELN